MRCALLSFGGGARVRDVARSVGNALFATGQPSEAKTFFERAVAADQNDPSLYNQLGLVHVRCGESSEAAPLLQKAIALADAALAAEVRAVDLRWCGSDGERAQSSPTTAASVRLRTLLANICANYVRDVGVVDVALSRGNRCRDTRWTTCSKRRWPRRSIGAPLRSTVGCSSALSSCFCVASNLRVQPTTR